MTNKYLRTIYGVDKEGNAGSLQVDVYDILDAYPTKNPALDQEGAVPGATRPQGPADRPG